MKDGLYVLKTLNEVRCIRKVKFSQIDLIHIAGTYEPRVCKIKM